MLDKDNGILLPPAGNSRMSGLVIVDVYVDQASILALRSGEQPVKCCCWPAMVVHPRCGDVVEYAGGPALVKLGTSTPRIRN